jgi:tetratricopeptide (TPR) repeat protein
LKIVYNLVQIKKILLSILISTGFLNCTTEESTNSLLAKEHINKAQVLVDSNNHKEAVSELTTAIKLFPANPEIFSLRAQVKRELKDDIGAIEDYGEVIMLNPDDGSAYYSKAVLKWPLDDDIGAIHDFNKVIELYGYMKASAFNYRGVIKIGMGDNYEGCANFSKAGELGFKQAYQNIKEFRN